MVNTEREEERRHVNSREEKVGGGLVSTQSSSHVSFPKDLSPIARMENRERKVGNDCQ